MKDDWVTIIPARHEIKEVARALIALAASPHDVRTGRGGMEFRVPPYLADLYTAPRKRRRARAADQAPVTEEGGE